MHAGWKLGLDFLETRAEFVLLWLGSLNVFLAHLLLDKCAADELLESALGGEDA